tara:strand:- start:97 stop:384 length:288 start_codon:yes stop_codon:yes gene_type:complete
MEIYIAKEGQSFFDISLLLFGTTSRALELVAQTELRSVTDVPAQGQPLNYEPVKSFNTNFYARNNITPASSDFTTDESAVYSGDYSKEYGTDFDT